MMSVLTHLLETDIPPSIIANANQAHWELLVAWIDPLAVLEACATQETSIITQYLSSLLRSIRPPARFWDKAFCDLLDIFLSMNLSPLSILLRLHSFQVLIFKIYVVSTYFYFRFLQKRSIFHLFQLQSYFTKHLSMEQFH